MTPTQFATRAKAAGYSWAALELDDYGNAGRWGPFQHACRSAGVLPGVWFTDGGNIVDTPPDAAFAIAELEGQGDYDGIVNAIQQNRLPACRKAVVTNFNVPLTDPQGRPRPEFAAPLVQANLECLTEAYMNENPNATPDNLDLMARNLGWPRSQPVFGVYSGSPSLYDPWRSWRGHSSYLAEYLPL